MVTPTLEEQIAWLTDGLTRADDLSLHTRFMYEAILESLRLRSPEANWAWPQLIRIEQALDGGDRATAQEIGDAVVAALNSRK